MGTFLSWKGALLYVTWASLYGYLMKTYWKWRMIMQYWYDSSTLEKMPFPAVSFACKTKKTNNKPATQPTRKQSVWKQAHRKAWWQVAEKELQSVVPTVVWCVMQKSPHGMRQDNIQASLCSWKSKGGQRVGKGSLHICLECGAKSNSRTQHCWQKWNLK